LEESGVAVELKGVLSIQYIPNCSRNFVYASLRVIFFAEPEDLTQVEWELT
jgi:hypothetical protein